MRSQAIPWLCLIISAQVIAYILASPSPDTGGARSREPVMEPSISKDEKFRKDKQNGADKTAKVGVIHERRGAYGGSDLNKSKTTHSAATNSFTPISGYVTLLLCFTVNYFAILL